MFSAALGPPAPENAELRVLLIEDNPGDARLLQIELAETRGRAFRITHALRLDAGLALLTAQPFDVVLLDLNLPDSSGLETFRRASKRAASKPIVVLSGLDDVQVGIEAVQAGAQDYLVKGQISPGLLERTIRYAVERAQAASRLRHQLSFLSAITDSLGEGVCAVDAEARVTFINPAGQRLLGRQRDEILGRTLAEMSAPRLPPAGARPDRGILEALKTGQSAHSEDGELGRPDGTRFAVSSTASPILADGKIVGAVFAFRDITERREVDRVKREFVSTVSHELRTPMTSIRGSLGLLASGVMGELSPEIRELLTLADRNVVRLLGLVNDILDFERLEGGQIAIESEPVVLAGVIAQAVESVQAFADQEGVRLLGGETDGVVLGDSGRLVQVLVNLLSNAIKFSLRGSSVTVEVLEREENLEVRVVDRGRGIPAAMHSRIFERFQQVDSSDSRGRGGTGLGLAICKLIVEQHGGSMGLESEEGQGSTFWFRVPKARTAGEADGAGNTRAFRDGEAA